MQEPFDKKESVPSGEKSPFSLRENRHRTLVRGIIAAGVGVAVIFGLLHYLHARSHESTDDAYLEGHIISVSSRVSGHVLKVCVDDNREVRKGDLLLELDPRDYEVRLEQARAALKVATARRNAAGETTGLTNIVSMAGMNEASAAVSRSRSAVETARFQVGSAKSRIEQVHAQRSTAEAAAEEASANVSALEAEAGRAAADYKRYQDAARSRGVSQQQLDQAAAADRAAAARLEGGRKNAAAARARVAEMEAAERVAKGNLLEAESMVAEAQARIQETLGRQAGARSAPRQIAASRFQAEAAAAEIELAKQKVRQAELELSYTKILAPEDGRVARRAVEPGAFAQAAAPLLAIVPKTVWVIANFKESQIARMRPGQPAQVRVDTYPGLVLKGHVDSIQMGTGSRFSLLPPENASGNFIKVVQRLPVKIVFDALPADRPLAPGMSVVPEVRVR